MSTVVAAIGTTDRIQCSTLSEQQRADTVLLLNISYLEDVVLPDDDKKARELVLAQD